MKLKLKNLSQETVVIEIEETKTVYELKKELSLHSDVGVQPEYLKIVYGGQILANENMLSSYDIDVDKFLTIHISQEQLCEPGTSKESKTRKEEEQGQTTNTVTSSSTTATSTVPEELNKEFLLTQIVEMGYPAPEVQKALAASFYNAERAIEYLVDGIPTSPTSISSSDPDNIDPSDILRNHPSFNIISSALQQNPELLNESIRRIAETNSPLLNLIDEHKEEFISVLLEGSGGKSDK